MEQWLVNNKKEIYGGKLVAGFPPWRPRFDPRSFHVGFVVDKVTLGQVFSKYFGFPCQFSLHWLLHIYHHLSSGTGTIGQTVADVQSGRLSLTPPQETLPPCTNTLVYPCEDWENSRQVSVWVSGRLCLKAATPDHESAVADFAHCHGNAKSIRKLSSFVGPRIRVHEPSVECTEQHCWARNVSTRGGSMWCTFAFCSLSEVQFLRKVTRAGIQRWLSQTHANTFLFSADVGMFSELYVIELSLLHLIVVVLYRFRGDS
jgi:hypothetical protein